MSNFNKKQLEELAASAIDHDIADLNIWVMDENRALEAIFYALGIEERINTGQVKAKWLRNYDPIYKDGGLAFFGVDPITDERTECISFKPNTPISPDRKYENPPKAPQQAFYPAVTYRVWHLVADRFKVPKPKGLLFANPNFKAVGFWSWVLENDIQIIITEGIKKALAAISQGFPCIAVTGIWNGVKAVRKDNGETDYYSLIPSLRHLKDKKILIAFDRDKAPATIKSVIQARSILAKELIEIGCECYSIRWDSNQAKGLDDLIVSGGIAALEKSIADAEELTGEIPNFKKPMAASILAEKIAKEWKSRVHFYLPNKSWRFYLKGIWEVLDEAEIETLLYNRILEDAPCLNSFNYVTTILKMVRGSLIVEK